MCGLQHSIIKYKGLHMYVMLIGHKWEAGGDPFALDRRFSLIYLRLQYIFARGRLQTTFTDFWPFLTPPPPG